MEGCAALNFLQPHYYVVTMIAYVFEINIIGSTLFLSTLFMFNLLGISKWMP